MMPEEVTVLSPRNMVIGPYRVNKTCGCIKYWWDKNFSRMVPHEYSMVEDALMDAWKVIGRGPEFGPGTNYCDEGHITKKQCSRAFNIGMAILGYTEGNPESGVLPVR